MADPQPEPPQPGMENIMWTTSLEIHDAAAAAPGAVGVPSAVTEEEEGGAENGDAAANAKGGGGNATVTAVENEDAAAKAGMPGGWLGKKVDGEGEKQQAGQQQGDATTADPAANPKPPTAGPAVPMENIMWSTTMDVHDAPPAVVPTAAAAPAAIKEQDETEPPSANAGGGGGGGATTTTTPSSSVKATHTAAIIKKSNKKHPATVGAPIVKRQKETAAPPHSNSKDKDKKATTVVVVAVDTSTTVPIVVHDGDPVRGVPSGEEVALVENATGKGAVSNIVQQGDDYGKQKRAGRQTGGKKANEIAKAADGDADTAAAARKQKAAAKARTAAAKQKKQPTASSSDSFATHQAKMAQLSADAATYESERAALSRQQKQRSQSQHRRHTTRTRDNDDDNNSGATPAAADAYAHRHFHNLHPTTNKLVGAKWDAVDRKIHARKLETVRSTIDTSAPRTYSHLENKKKTVQLAMERQAQIDRDNDILLEKMAGIMKMERKQYDQVPSPMRFAHSLHAGKRARDCAQIDKDNLAILARLEARTSFYPHGEHLASRRQNLHYLCNMAAYPTRFQAQEKIYTLLTRTHMNAHDPALGSARREEIVRDWTTPSMTGAVAHETREKMERERKRQLREAAAREEQVKAAKEAKAARASSPKLPVAETDKALLSKPGSAPASPPLLPRIKSRSTHELEREVSPVQVPMAAIQAV